MSSLHFAWAFFKLALGIVLILAAAIYTIARFLASVMHIDAYQPTLCGAEAHLFSPDGEEERWVSCDRPAGHDGFHHDDAFRTDWSEAPAAEVSP